MKDKKSSFKIEIFIKAADICSGSHPFSRDLDTWSDLAREVGKFHLYWVNWLDFNLVQLKLKRFHLLRGEGKNR